jgi:hypothetical protein
MIRPDNIKFNLVGSESREYASYARNVAIGLIPAAQALGGHMTKSLMFDGATIIIRFSDPFITIYINKETAGSNIIHGLVSGGTIEYADPDVDGDKDELKMFYPSSDMAVIGKIEREFIKEKRIGVIPDADIDITSTSIQMAQAGVICSSLFTGKMRKVVQLLLGTPYFNVKYRWKFNQTHGVYVDSDGNDWLIEISQNNGVLAMKMPKKAIGINASANQSLIARNFSYIPTGISFSDFQDLDAEIASGKVRRLMPASGLNEFYGKQSFYEDCGWAFSDDGHGISNVCWDHPGRYKRSYLYDISISEEDGGPSSASISMSETGPLAGFGYMHFPAFSSKFELKTFEYSINPDAPAEDIGSSWSAPIFVCYNGYVKKIVRGIYKKSEKSGIQLGDDIYDYVEGVGFGDIIDYLKDDGMIVYSLPYIAGKVCSGFPYVSLNIAKNYSFVSKISGNNVGYFSGDGLSDGIDVNYASKIDLEFEIGDAGKNLGRSMEMLLHVTDGYYSQSKIKKYTGGNDYSYNSVAISPRNRSSYFCGNLSGSNASRTYDSAVNKDGLFRRGDLLGASEIPTAYYWWTFWGTHAGNTTCSEGCYCTAPSENQPSNQMSTYKNWPEGAVVAPRDVPFPSYTTASRNVCGENYDFGSTTYMNVVCFDCTCPAGGSEDVALRYESLTFVDHENGSVNSYSCNISDFFRFYDASPMSLYHLYFNSGSSSFKGSSFNSMIPNGIQGSDLDIKNSDGEPIVDSGSRISWVGIA